MSKHGYCIFHLSQNVKIRVHGSNRELVAEKFKECAQTYTEADFERMYDAFKTRYPKAADYLNETRQDVRKWARCYFPGERYNIDTTNCAESINAIFREARKYSLLPMIDAIVGKIPEWFNKHRKASNEVSPSQKLVPFVAGVLHTRCEIAKKLRVKELNSFELKYSVIGREGKEYLVDLIRKRCSCKHFDIDKYPCEHGLAAAMAYTSTGNKLYVHELCSSYYLMEQWMLAYCRTIFPVPHISDWNVPDHIQGSCVLPPNKVKRKGRTQEARYPSVGEYQRRSNRILRSFFFGDNSGTNC